MNNENVIKFFISEILNFAFFEDRRFEKSSSERYLFIYKSFLIARFPNLKSKVDSYIPKENPLSEHNSKCSLILLNEVKEILTPLDYNLVLRELTEQATTFDQANIIFPMLVRNDKFDSTTINRILTLCLIKQTIKGSFEAQNLILNLILNNINFIDHNLIVEILNKFPYKRNSFIAKENERIENLLSNIHANLKLNHSKPRIEFETNSLSINHEVEAGENELRRWNEEDPSWQIANDVG